MPRFLLACGGNAVGHEHVLCQAQQRIAALPDVQVIGQSDRFRSTPSGGPRNQPAYTNSALLLDTLLSPLQLWTLIQGIEQSLGRERRQRWGSRQVDLDLICCEQLVVQTAELTLPHPRWIVRQFVLQPALQLIPDWSDPLSQLPLAEIAHRWQTVPRVFGFAGFSHAEVNLWRQQLGPEAARPDVSFQHVGPDRQPPPTVVFVPAAWYPVLPLDGVPPVLRGLPRVPLQFDPVDEIRAALLASHPDACKIVD